jgi:hypothetical protein
MTKEALQKRVRELEEQLHQMEKYAEQTIVLYKALIKDLTAELKRSKEV